MDENPGEDSDLAEARYEAAVQIGYLTGGEYGGVFDNSRTPRHGVSESRGMLGTSRPHSAAIWRVRVVSMISGIALAVLTVASPFVLALTIGWVPAVTGVLFLLTIAAFATLIGTYFAERREITRRTAQDGAARNTDPGS